VEYSQAEQDRKLGQLVGEFVSRAGSAGFTLKQLMTALRDLDPGEDFNRQDKVQEEKS
jgi:hypothetical protein